MIYGTALLSCDTLRWMFFSAMPIDDKNADYFWGASALFLGGAIALVGLTAPELRGSYRKRRMQSFRFF